MIRRVQRSPTISRARASEQFWNNLVEVIGNRTPMTVEEFVTDRKQAFDRNGPNFVPAKPG